MSKNKRIEGILEAIIIWSIPKADFIYVSFLGLIIIFIFHFSLLLIPIFYYYFLIIFIDLITFVINFISSPFPYKFSIFTTIIITLY